MHWQSFAPGLLSCTNSIVCSGLRSAEEERHMDLQRVETIMEWLASILGEKPSFEVTTHPRRIH